MTEKKIPERSEIEQNDQWDLAPLFKTIDQWEKTFNSIEDKIEKYNSFKGKLHESFDIFKEAIDFDLSISRDLEKIYTYAHLKNDEDKTNQSNLALYQRSVNLYRRLSEESSFLSPEIQSIPDDIMKEYLANEKISQYKFYLEKILRYKPHTNSKEIEQILAMSGDVAQAPSETFSQLDNADLKFGIIEDEKGNKIELSQGNFSTFLMNQSRDIRKKAFFQFYKAYDDHKNTASTTLSYSNMKDVFYSRVRKFENSRNAALFSDNVSEKVYDNLLDSVKNNIHHLEKYLNFRKETLGLDELHFYDTYVPLVDEVDFHMPYEEAVNVCVEAIKPLGEEYQEILKKGLLEGWVDRYENKGKRSGAYSSGCYDSPPYILMNYKEDNISSLYTLMHEAGHSMHSYYSCKNQPYIYNSYTIFVAEVASTFNETFLTKYLLEKHKDDKKMKAYIINREIDNIRGTLYRQSMFAEFEKITHQIVEENKPLTLEVITNTYRDLLKIHFGNSIVIDEELTLECLRIPHFYSAYYVYKYATGISAAIALAKKVSDEGENARDKYINFLKLGGSKFPLDELMDAGIDMNTPEPIENALNHFGKQVDLLIEIMKTL